MTNSMLDYVNRFFHCVKQAIDCYTTGEEYSTWLANCENLLHIVANHSEQYPTPENMRTFDTMLEMMGVLYTLQAYAKTHDTINRVLSDYNWFKDKYLLHAEIRMIIFGYYY